MKYCSRPTLLGRLPVSRGNGAAFAWLRRAMVPRLQQEKKDTSFLNMLSIVSFEYEDDDENEEDFAAGAPGGS